MSTTPKRPVAVVGSGNLCSHLYRRSGDESYRFSIARCSQGRMGNVLSENDLWDLVKLCHVLTFAILDDGWLDEVRRHDLKTLLRDLESITLPPHSAEVHVDDSSQD